MRRPGWLLLLALIVLPMLLAACDTRRGSRGGGDDDDFAEGDDDDAQANDDDAQANDDDAQANDDDVQPDDDDVQPDDDDVQPDDDDNADGYYGPDNSWWHAWASDVPSGLSGTGWTNGSTAYDFTFADQFGEQVQLYQFYGKVIVIDVFAFW